MLAGYTPQDEIGYEQSAPRPLLGVGERKHVSFHSLRLGRHRLRTIGTPACIGLAITLIGSCATHKAPARSAGAGSGFRYEVAAGPGARELTVDAEFAKGASDDLTLDDATAPFVRDVQFATDDSWNAAEKAVHGWKMHGCADNGCRVRYRFNLAEAAAALGGPGEAEGNGASLEAPPSSWLVHPMTPASGAPFRFRVTTPPGLDFVSGSWPLAGSDGTYQGDVFDLNSSPYAAFGPLHPRPLEGTPVILAIARATQAAAATTSSVRDEQIVAWAANAARAVTLFYGRFPVPRVALIVSTALGARIDDGMTMGGGGAAIVIEVGESTRQRAFDEDWELTHEMVHTALPSLHRDYHWLEEGIATYVEPIARARAGIITPEEAWGGMIKGMPQGQPETGDRGLDGTHSWGRTYWGGAMFCLLADVAIRERTHNTRSLDDALRGILAAGGNISVEWSIERVLSVGDDAVGVPVLRELHDRMGGVGVREDLDGLFARLGVHAGQDDATFDDDAPLAAIRRAITARPATPAP